MKRVTTTVFLATVACGAWWFLRDVPEPVRLPRTAGEPALPEPTPVRTPPGVVRAVDGPSPGAPVAGDPSVPLPEDVTRDAPAPDVLPGGRDAIPGEYVFGFYNWQESNAFVRRAKELGIDVLDRIALGNSVRIGTGDAAALRRLLSEGPRPVHFGPNYAIRTPPGPPPGDARAPESGYTGFGPRLLEWLGVENNARWGEGVTVAVLDTAVGTHAALPESNLRRLQLEGDASSGSGSAAGHGTAVASLIVGRGEGLSGIAPAAEILSVPVMASDGSGDTFTLARGIMEAVSLGADVINLSLGTYGDSPVVSEAVAYARENGVAVVAATGNDAVGTVTYPARYDGVVAVGGTDANNQHLYFSNRGDEVDLVAPGIGLNAAWGDDALVGFSGTSAAAPVVSAAIAALVSENPGMSGVEAAELLTRYADDHGAPGADDEYGGGVVNIGRVMTRDVPGIYDAAAAPAYVDESAGEESQYAVAAYAQNRGTEPASALTLQVEIDGESHAFTFRNVGVGETVSHVFMMEHGDLADSGVVSVRTRVAIDGVEDANPRNNSSQVVLQPTLVP